MTTESKARNVTLPGARPYPTLESQVECPYIADIRETFSQVSPAIVNMASFAPESSASEWDSLIETRPTHEPETTTERETIAHNYAERLEEVLGHDDRDGDEEFHYDGVDADSETSRGYSQQLQDVLGEDGHSPTHQDPGHTFHDLGMTSGELENQVLSDDDEVAFSYPDQDDVSLSTRYTAMSH